MAAFLVRRILSVVPVLLVVAVLVFLMLRMVPGDPAVVLAGDTATPEQILQIRERMGLERPIVVQFGQYALACWVGIAVQFGLTNLFALFLHYLAANLIAVVIASLFNFVANDIWTFGRLKLRREKARTFTQ